MRIAEDLAGALQVSGMPASCPLVPSSRRVHSLAQAAGRGVRGARGACRAQALPAVLSQEQHKLLDQFWEARGVADWESRRYLIAAALQYQGSPQAVQPGEEQGRISGLKMYWELTDRRERSTAQAGHACTSTLLVSTRQHCCLQVVHIW